MEKWLKMVKKWDKYKSSDRVSVHTRPATCMITNIFFNGVYVSLGQCGRVWVITVKYVKLEPLSFLVVFEIIL